MRTTSQLRGWRVRAGLAALAVVGVTITATAAQWTDTSETVTNITTGQVTLSATGESGGVFTLGSIDTSNIMPGWSGEQTFDLNNGSTGDIKVDLTSGSVSNAALTGALQIEIRETNAAGAVLYAQGPLSGAHFDDLGIAEGGAKTLWVRLSAPSSLDQSFSGQSGAVTLVFRADPDFS